MLSTPTLSVEEQRSNATFDALLGALSRPGLVKTLPATAEDAVVEALIDRECRVFCADPLLMSKVLATGALVAELGEADHVFLGHLQEADLLTKICAGSDMYPDDGATVVVKAGLNNGSKLRLSGPGIETTIEVSISGLPDGFWAARRDAIRYPMGFDLFFVDGDQVLGVPRSTMVEVL